MKPKTMPVLLLLLLAVPSSAIGESNSKSRVAEEIIVLMRIDKTQDTALAQLKSHFTSLIEKMDFSEDEKVFRQKLVNNITKMIDEELKPERVKADLVKIYVDIFSESELRGLLEFFNSPIGKSFLDKEALLNKRLLELSQSYAVTMYPKIKSIAEDIQAEMERNRKK